MSVPKSVYNSFGGYYYRNIEDILKTIKPFLEELNLVLLLNDEIVTIGSRFYVKSTARFVNAENPSEYAEVVGFAREQDSKKKMDDAQVTGAASTYARKRALSGLLALDDNKDADSQAPEEEPKEQPKEAGKSVAELQKLIIILEKKLSLSKDDIITNRKAYLGNRPKYKDYLSYIKLLENWQKEKGEVK